MFVNGTAKELKVNGIDICGKSGTAENFTKINGKKTQLTDHSIFVAYAPKNNPQIAIAVLVENGYYGSTWAGRISSLMIEKYLKGNISNQRIENLVINKSLDDEYQKPFSNKPFKILYVSDFLPYKNNINVVQAVSELILEGHNIIMVKTLPEMKWQIFWINMRK